MSITSKNSNIQDGVGWRPGLST